MECMHVVACLLLLASDVLCRPQMITNAREQIARIRERLAGDVQGTKVVRDALALGHDGIATYVRQEEQLWEESPLDIVWQSYLLVIIDLALEDVSQVTLNKRASELSAEEFANLTGLASQVTTEVYTTLLQSCPEGQLPYAPLIFSSGLVGLSLTEPFTGPLFGVIYNQMVFSFGMDETEELLGQAWSSMVQLDMDVELECESTLEVLVDLQGYSAAYERAENYLDMMMWWVYQEQNWGVPDMFFFMVFGLLEAYVNVESGCADSSLVGVVLEEVQKVTPNFDISAGSFLSLDPTLLQWVNSYFLEDVQTLLNAVINTYTETMTVTLDVLSEGLAQMDLVGIAQAPMICTGVLMPYLVAMNQSAPNAVLLEAVTPESYASAMSADELLQDLVQQYAMEQGLELEGSMAELLGAIVYSLWSHLSEVTGVDSEALVREILSAALMAGSDNADAQEIINNQPDFDAN